MSDINKQYTLLDSYHKIQNAIDHLQKYEVIAYDTETTGLNVRKDKIIGISFTGEVGVGFYYPIWVYNVETKVVEPHPYYDEATLNSLLSILKTKKLVMHNASYDVRITANNLKVNLLSSLHADTVLMEHTINEDGPFGLKDICIRRAMELGLDQQDAANQEQLELKESVLRNGGKWIKDQKDMYKGDLDILSKYACADVDMTLRLYHYHSKQLEYQNLSKLFYEDEVMPLYKYVTIRMESRGIHIDMKRLAMLRLEISKELNEFESTVIKSLVSLPEWNSYIQDTLSEEFPISNKGSFAQSLCKELDVELPISDNGKFS